MDIFHVISLLGGLAMFLYGMRLMGDSLKENSSGTLKRVMGKVTDNAFKAFLLGVAVTALIQSSTATIVITAGLVSAGILTLRQSLGILVGANLGTTVTGQIIRLLDIDASGTACRGRQNLPCLQGRGSGIKAGGGVHSVRSSCLSRPGAALIPPR